MTRGDPPRRRGPPGRPGGGPPQEGTDGAGSAKPEGAASGGTARSADPGPAGPLRGLGRALDAATQGLNVAGSLLIAALMVLIGADVAGRALLGLPTAGVPEIVTLSIVAIVFLQLPAAFRAGRLTRSDALLGRLRRSAPRAGLVMEAVFDLLAVAMLAVIVRATRPMLADAWREGDFVGAIGNVTAPTWPVKATIVLGGTLLIAQLLRRAAGSLRDADR